MAWAATMSEEVRTKAKDQIVYVYNWQKVGYFKKDTRKRSIASNLMSPNCDRQVGLDLQSPADLRKHAIPLFTVSYCSNSNR